MGIDDDLDAAQRSQALQLSAQKRRAEMWGQRRAAYDEEETQAARDIVSAVERTLQRVGTSGAKDQQVSRKGFLSPGKVRGWCVFVSGHSYSSILGVDGRMFEVNIPAKSTRSLPVTEWATEVVRGVRIVVGDSWTDVYSELFDGPFDDYTERRRRVEDLEKMRKRLHDIRENVMKAMGIILNAATQTS